MRALLLIPLVTALVACGDGDDEPAADTVAPVSPTDEEPGETAPETTGPTEPPTAPTLSSVPGAVTPVDSEPAGTVPGFPIDPSEPLVTAAVDDLARRLRVDVAEVTVVDARAVTWGDSSLGCPQPGMMYPQVLVDGTLVILSAGGQRYEYHGGDPLFLCENPTRPSGGG